MGSETGVVNLDESKIIEKGRLGPGQMLAVDLQKGAILRNWEVKSAAANRYEYKKLLNKSEINNKSKKNKHKFIN